jgi:pyrroline-5-carboxylate reductase
MGSAIVRGWLKAGVGGMQAYDQDPSRTRILAEAVGPELQVVAALDEITAAEIVVSVKPQDMERVLKELAPGLDAGHLVVSTAAGVSLSRLRERLGQGPALARIMPNLAVGIGEGVIAVAMEDSTHTAEDRVLDLVTPLGHVELLPESLFNAVTALTASGPGLLALVLEGLEDGGVRVGLPRQVARTFTQKMALGTLRLLLEEDTTPTALKERVASAGGTTIAGLGVLEDRGVRGALLRAVEAAADRGRDL